MSNDTRIILCFPRLYEYKGILFEAMGIGAPYWPVKRDTCYPYERLTKMMWTAIDELCAMTDEEREGYRIKDESA